MSIQSNINNALSIATLLWSQTDAYKQMAEKQKTRKNLTKAETAENVALDEYVESIEKIDKNENLSPESKDKAILDLPQYNTWMEAAERTSSIEEKLMYLDPSEKNVKRVNASRDAIQDQRDIIAEERKKLEEKRSKAAADQIKEQERIANSRNFAKMITEGVTLSPSSQEYVNKYTGPGGKK
jgi:hypothetical protein